MAHRILIQAGHVAPREPGFESQTGTPGEQVFTLTLREEIAWFLDNRYPKGAFVVLQEPGAIPDGVRVDSALYLHADGSTHPVTSGWSFGYPTDREGPSRRMADLLSGVFNRLGHPGERLPDNYTPDVAGYYGFSRVDTDPAGFELLIESGFLTNLDDRSFLGMYQGPGGVWLARTAIDRHQRRTLWAACIALMIGSWYAVAPRQTLATTTTWSVAVDVVEHFARLPKFTR